MRTRSIGDLLVASLLWATTWTLSPTLAANAEPFAASALCFALAALVAAGASLVYCETAMSAHASVTTLSDVAANSSDAAPRLRWRTHLVLGATMFALPLPLLLMAGSHGAAGWVPLVYSALPLCVALVASAWSTVKSSIVILAIGAALLLLGPTLSFAPRAILWLLPVLVAVISQAIALHYAAKHLRGCSLRAILRSLTVQFVLAALVCALGSALADAAPRLAPLAQWTSLPCGALLLLAMPGTALPYALFYWLLSRGVLTPQQVAVTQWLQTLLTIAEGCALSRELPPTRLLIAGALLLACCWSMLTPDSEPPDLTLRAT